MRRIQLIIISLTMLSACTVGEQIMELKTLKQCKFAVSKIEKVTISGININEVIQNGKVDLFKAPELALGFLEGSILLQANLVIEISNPTQNRAAINQFDYKLSINQHEVVEGTIDQEISIAANESSLVPFEFSFDIYKFLADDSLRNSIQTFLLASEKLEAKEIQLIVKVKPGILVGDQLIKYPGFIDVEKTFSTERLAYYNLPL